MQLSCAHYLRHCPTSQEHKYTQLPRIAESTLMMYVAISYTYNHAQGSETTIYFTFLKILLILHSTKTQRRVI